MRRLVIGDIHGGYKSLIQVLDRAGFDPKEDMLIGIGDYVDGWPETSKVLDFLINLPNFKGVLGNHDCFSKDTECLTNSGWKNYKDISLEDKVLSIDTEKNTLVWDNIEKIIIKNHDGFLYNFSNNHVDMMITETHRVLHQKRGGDKKWGGFEYSHINDLKGRNRVPTSGLCEKIGLDLTNEEIRFIAWILTDGGISKNKGHNYYHIYQSKEKTTGIIRKLLEDLEYDFSEYVRNREVKEVCGKNLVKECLPEHSFRIIGDSTKRVREFLPEKYPFPKFLFNMNKSQFDVFLNEVILGDGTYYDRIENSKTSVIYGEKEFLDNLQILCVQNNFRANVAIDTRGNFKLNISEQVSTSFDIKNEIVKTPYTDDVWCLSVPKTNFMVRRNGKAFFSGNCWAIDWMLGRYSERVWINQGGQATIDSYKGNILLQDVVKHGEWLSSLPYCLEIDNKLFIHGGCKNLSNVKSEFGWDIMWDRDLWGKIALKYAYPNKYKDVFSTDPYDEVYLGHTTTSRARQDLLPISIDNFHLIDQGGGWEGKLTLMDIDTHEFWQSDLVKDLYPDIKGR